MTSLALSTLPWAAGCRDDSPNAGNVFRPVDAQAPDMRRIGSDATADAEPAADVAFLDGTTPDATMVIDAGPADAGADAEQADATLEVRDPACISPLPARTPQALSWEGDCGEPGSVRSIRNPTCPSYREPPTGFPGIDVALDAAVVVAVFGTDLVVMDAEGEAFNAVWVFNRGMSDLAGIRPGSLVRVEGELIRFFDLDEIVTARGGIELVAQGIAPPPLRVTDPATVADDGVLARALESRLVTVEDVQVVNTAPDCPADFGNFVVSDGLWVSPQTELDSPPVRGDILTRLTGVLSVSFGHRKLLTRDPADIEAIPCFGAPDKCEEAACPVAEDAEESGTLVISEIQNNPTGSDQTREYLELTNPGAVAVDLTGWRVQDCGGNTAALSGSLRPGDALVVGGSLDVSEAGGATVDALLGDLFLPNGFGSVLVFDDRGALVDQVRYAPDAPFPRRDPGHALELNALDQDNRAGASWREADTRYGEAGFGSPGRAP